MHRGMCNSYNYVAQQCQLEVAHSEVSCHNITNLDNLVCIATFGNSKSAMHTIAKIGIKTLMVLL